MNKTSQNAWVLTQIQENGYVSRNQALEKRITRLAARAADLKHAGFPVIGERVETEHGTDYRYRLAA